MPRGKKKCGMRGRITKVIRSCTILCHRFKEKVIIDAIPQGNICRKDCPCNIGIVERQ